MLKLYNMGNALKDQGKLEEAIESYNKALSLKPDYAEAYNNMGNALKDQGKLEEAIEAYNKALSSSLIMLSLLQHGQCSQRSRQAGRGDSVLQQSAVIEA